MMSELDLDDPFSVGADEPIRLRVIQLQHNKWHAQVIRLRDGAVYDSFPMDTRDEAIKCAQNLLDNCLPDGTSIHFDGAGATELVSAALTEKEKAVASKLLAMMLEPTKEAISAGETVLEDHRDSDWDSGPHGESHNSYEIIRPGAARAINEAMLVAFADEHGIDLPDEEEEAEQPPC